MMEQEINTLVGAFSNVLRPYNRRPRILKNPKMVFWDTEFDDKGLISSQFAWFEGDALKSKIMFLNDLDREKLYNIITGLVGKEGRIFVISHFAQSELKHLSDLWELDLSVYHKSMYAQYKNIHFVDSYAHFLCGLDKIGKSVGVPKIEIGDWIKDMRGLLKHNPELFKRYALRDVEVLAKAWVKRRDFMIETFGIDILNCVTIAQSSLVAFKVNYLREPLEPLKYYWSKKVRRENEGWKEYWVKDYYYGGSRDRRYYALKSYWGGRREAFGRGLLKCPIEIWDVKSMYPHMALLPLPLKDTRWFYTEDLTDIDSLEGFINCKFKFDDDVDYPCLPVMHSKFPKLLFPKEGETFCTIPEVRLALRLGCTVSNPKIWGFYPTRYEENHPLKDYILKCMEIKENAEKGSVEYETAKLLMNSIIGKFMQRNPLYAVEDALDLLRSMGYDFDALRDYLAKQKTRQMLRRPKFVSKDWSPEWGTIILGLSIPSIWDFSLKPV